MKSQLPITIFAALALLLGATAIPLTDEEGDSMIAIGQVFDMVTVARANAAASVIADAIVTGAAGESIHPSHPIQCLNVS